MSKIIVVVSVIIIFCDYVNCGSQIFHLNSKITLRPSVPASYFGYTVVLNDKRLIVGAPKANRTKDSMTSGVVFICSLKPLKQPNGTCEPMVIDDKDKSSGRVIRVKDFFRNDMWFGATIATFPEGKLLICAPRWTDPYSDKHLLATGACYVETKRQGRTLIPLKDPHNLAFQTDGVRKEYGEYGTHLNLYAYGQAGMSIKVTESNSIIIGAPGLLQWTGGIIDYKYSTSPNSAYFLKQPTTNPYYTKDLGPDDYLGYSVESGNFEVNGSTLYVAGAPRSTGFGQVLIFEPAVRSNDPIRIVAKLKGPQLGSYFGASICSTDLNGDGRSDLLVGAPNFVVRDDEAPYDQGAVFIYLADGEPSKLTMKSDSFVIGDGASGARFGSAITAIGDIDGDGFVDVAIGAPWEDDGVGAVYIYKGKADGLNKAYSQKIVAQDARSFGISLSKGDVDENNCNDLAVGAHNSDTAYIYRCIPSIEVHASIKIPDAMNLPKNVTNFKAVFCVLVPPSKLWPHVKIDLQASITVDPDGERASVVGGSEFQIKAVPGRNICEEEDIEVKPTADLSKPILIKFDLQPKEPLFDKSVTFHNDAARISEKSTLNTSFLIQLIRDCGEDLICVPYLEMSMESLKEKYVPGSNDSLGVRIKVTNIEEPAYGAQVFVSLPLTPKRVPGSCSLEALNLTCDVPAPLDRGTTAEWEIELEYAKSAEEHVLVNAELILPIGSRNASGEKHKKVDIQVVPMANFNVVGKPLPNVTITVTREKYKKLEDVTFVHYFEIRNLGPSDWSNLQATFSLPPNVTLLNSVEGCDNSSVNILSCTWPLRAEVSLPVALSLRYDLNEFGQYLEEQVMANFTTTITLLLKEQQSLTILTTMVLDPAAPIWPLIVGTVAGFLLLAAIVFGLYKYGFFSRTKREELKKLIEESPSEAGGTSSSSQGLGNESTDVLLSDDSD